MITFGLEEGGRPRRRIWSGSTASPSFDMMQDGEKADPRGAAGARRAQREKRPGRRRRRPGPGRSGAEAMPRGSGAPSGARAAASSTRASYHGAHGLRRLRPPPRGAPGPAGPPSRRLGYERVICAFQPHTYSRTKALFGDFVRGAEAPDITLLAEIFAARETERRWASPPRIWPSASPAAEYCATLAEVTAPPARSWPSPAT